MLNTIKKSFDDFTFTTRVMPVMVVSIPIILLGIFKGIVNESILTSTVYTLVIIAFFAFAARVARELGKRYQTKMYYKLKEMPTTIVLRYSDNQIDRVTKTRYHKKLNKVVEGVQLPLEPKDETEDSDKHYESAMNWLRNYANTNRDKEHRVYEELKEYNFWRNLYGIKYIAISMYALIGLREYCINDSFIWQEIIAKPYPQYVAFATMIISILLFFVSVKKSTVDKKAFDYAKTLAEVCERV